MGFFEDFLTNHIEKKVPRDESEELILLRVKLEARTMFMRLWQTIAAGLFTGIVTGVVTKLIFK